MDIGKELVSGIATVALTSSIANPVCAGLVSATIQPLFTGVIEEFGKRVLSIRENNRVNKVIHDAVCKINARLEKGEIPRQDDEFWMDNYVDISDAKAILEGILLKSRDEYEEKKLPYYSNLIARMAFDSSWSYQRLNAMIRMFEQLSYRQIQLIALAQRKGEIETPQWDVKFKRTSESFAYYDLFCEVSNLSSLTLFHQPDGYLMMGLGNKQALSPIGESIADLMELSSMSQEEIEKLDEIISFLNAKILHM